MEIDLYQTSEEQQHLSRRYMAIYLRLSDKEKKEGIYKKESDSIESQRNLIHSFIQTQDELSKYPVREFLDDGSSGVHFRRVGVQKLLTEVEKGRIACIIVKDLSRFGRDYMEAGMYLEQVFPRLGVRFIAVTDQYDSFNNSSTIETGFKNLIHDRYSKDLSKKIKSVKLLQQQKGVYSGGDVPYGYKKTAGKQEIFQPDPDTAAYVTKIFSLAASGSSPSAIARYLNQHKIPTPGAYKTQNTKQHYQLKNKKSNLWTSPQVRIILQNEAYLGTYLCHKSTTYRPRESKLLEAAEYFRFEHAYPALISKEKFETVQHTWMHYGKRGRYQKKPPAHPLVGKIKCGHCGYSARLGGRAPSFYFCCRMGENCGSRSRAEAQDLEQIIKIIQLQVELLQIKNQIENRIEKIEIYKENRIEILVLISNQLTY